jgi:hypothetical protein
MTISYRKAGNPIDEDRLPSFAEQLRFVGAALAFLAISGCVASDTQECTAVASAEEAAKADDLVNRFRMDLRGPQDARAFAATYDLIDARACNGTVILDYSPKSFESSGKVIVGSSVRYGVDLERQTVVEEYLD